VGHLQEENMYSRRVLIALVVAASVFAPLARAATARAEALELDDKERAQLAKETLKQKRVGTAQISGDQPTTCGSVDIGNTANQTGSSRIADRQTTVIVTGNVYNTATCKR
jgi:Ni/Co efflux regulator RcnB